MKWNKPPLDTESVREISRRFETDLLTAAILVRRELTVGEHLPFWLENDLRYLHDPFLFEDMPEAVERILAASEEGERVLVFGDRDVDGITSTVVMVQTLRELGLDVSWKVPEGDDSYGLTMDVVEEFAAEDGTLIVTVDCGITSSAEIQRGLELGVDTIVVDHHNLQGDLPPAVAIINPKVGDGYPFDGLCACAVTAKVRQALRASQTELFQQELTLVNARPLNDTILVEVVSLENGIEVDRLSEVLVPGVANLQSSRLGPFLLGRTLVAMDVPLQQRLLQRALGGSVEVYLLDLADQIRELFPALAGKSLLELIAGSKLARYQSAPPEEIDALVALYQSVVNARFPQIRESLQEVLDLVAIATLADMMPMTDENRLLVRWGLDRLNTNPRPSLAVLLTTLGLSGRPVASRDVGWNISPVINASGRMGTPGKAVELLLSEDLPQQQALAKEIVELNKLRRKVGETGWRSVLSKVDQALERGQGKVIALYDPEVHRGVTGIIAGRLSRRFNVPAIVLTAVGEVAIGSVRSARGFMATRFLHNFDDIFEKWGGHDEAAGFNLPTSRLDAFWERFDGVAASVEISDEAEAELEIDAELPPKYLTPSLEEVVRRFEPYGQANRELRFLARNVVLEEAQLIGKEQDHLRMLVAGGGFKWPAVFWGGAPRVPRDFAVKDRLDVVFEFTRNYYNGNDTVQLVVVDARRSERQLTEGPATA